MNCHASKYVGKTARHNAPSTIDWDTYDGTSTTNKTKGNSRAQNGDQPPDDEFGSLNLNDFQKELFQKWTDQGFLQ